MTAIVHAVYSYMYVTALDLAILDTEDPGDRRARILRRLVVNVSRLEDGRDEIRRHLRVDDSGEQFFAGFHAWLDE